MSIAGNCIELPEGLNQGLNGMGDRLEASQHWLY